MRDADGARFGAGETRAGDAEASRRGQADALDHERRDRRRHDADRHLGHGEAGVGGGDTDVGDAGEAEAAAHGIALDRGDHRLRGGVHRLHHRAEAAVVLLELVGCPRGSRRGRIAGDREVFQIGAGAKRAAGPAQHHHAHGTVVSDRREGRQNLARHLCAERIADLRAVEREVQDRAASLELDVRSLWQVRHWPPSARERSTYRGACP